MKLHNNEVIEDLGFNGAKFIQNKLLYRFSSDSVIISNLVSVRKDKTYKVLDLGTGSGIIATLIALKNEKAVVDAIEIQESLYDLLKKNVELNSLENKINALFGDYNKFEFNKSYYDIVVCNPPYFKPDQGFLKKNESLAIARSEVTTTLDDIVKVASSVLNSSGYFYIIYKSERLVELIQTLTKYKLQPKVAYMLQPKKDKQIDTVIIKAKKGAKGGLRLHNLLVYNDDNTYTDQVLQLYNKS